MKQFLLGVLAVVFAVTLGGCFGDPVKSDIEKYLEVDSKVAEKYNPQIMADFQRRANSAKSPQEASVVMNEFKVLLEDARKSFEELKPKSKEMQEHVGTIDGAFGLMIKGFTNLDEAIQTDNQNLAIEALQDVMKAATDVESAEDAIVKLANEKGMKVERRR